MCIARRPFPHQWTEIHIIRYFSISKSRKFAFVASRIAEKARLSICSFTNRKKFDYTYGEAKVGETRVLEQFTAEAMEMIASRDIIMS